MSGSIEIHSPDICRELHLLWQEQEDDLDQNVVQLTNRVVMMSPQRPSSHETGRISRTVSRDTGRLSRLSSAAQIANVQSWLTQKARRAVIALPEAPEVREMEELCKALLLKEHDLISELEATVDSLASEAVSKREMLYHKWSSRVFDPLHTHVTMVMSGRPYVKLDKEKRALLQKYLDYCNKKSVFLETVGNEGYNPLSLSDHHTQLKAVSGVLNDPLLTQQIDRDMEQHIITGSHDDRSCVERGLDAVRWLAIQLVDVDSSVRERARRCVHRDHNEMQGGGGDLQLPHKTPATLAHSPLSLAWPQSHH